nr:MAG TPA: hypothetical protein [Caudoviricetes sp.]
MYNKILVLICSTLMSMLNTFFTLFKITTKVYFAMRLVFLIEL